LCRSPCSVKFRLSFSEVNCFCALWNFEVQVGHLEWWRRPVKISTRA
jgi:hypothetical protein